MTSLYWAFLTIATIGYGDITPTTDFEKIYVMVILVLACGIFAYIVGYVGSILDKKDTIIAEFE